MPKHLQIALIVDTLLWALAAGTFYRFGHPWAAGFCILWITGTHIYAWTRKY